MQRDPQADRRDLARHHRAGGRRRPAGLSPGHPRARTGRPRRPHRPLRRPDPAVHRPGHPRHSGRDAGHRGGAGLHGRGRVLLPWPRADRGVGRPARPRRRRLRDRRRAAGGPAPPGHGGAGRRRGRRLRGGPVRHGAGRRRDRGRVRRHRPRRPRPSAGRPRRPSLLDRAARGRCPGPPRLCRRPGRVVGVHGRARLSGHLPRRAGGGPGRGPGRRLRRRGTLPGRPRAAGGRRRLRLPGRHPRPGDGQRSPPTWPRPSSMPTTSNWRASSPLPPARARSRAWAPATSR